LILGERDRAQFFTVSSGAPTSRALRHDLELGGGLLQRAPRYAALISARSTGHRSNRSKCINLWRATATKQTHYEDPVIERARKKRDGVRPKVRQRLGAGRVQEPPAP
jgi:hypothetical protein